jgi:short-subunit dehydrogenase
MYNPFTLENKNIIVTGASSGIGQQVAITCSMMGAKVALIGRNKERLEETHKQLEGDGHLVVSYDLTDLEHQKELVSGIVAQMGMIDGLVNCAGISTTLPFKLMTPEKLEEFFKTTTVALIF